VTRVNILYKNANNISKRRNDDYWYDIMVQNYYIDKLKNLDSKELDKEFNTALKLFVSLLNKLSQKEKKAFINLFAQLIEFYIENKIEKELYKSFTKILKIQ